MNLLRTHLVGMQPCSQSSGFKFLFLFLECNRSHVRTIASQMFLFYFWSAIVRTYERLQVKFLFLFLECNRSYVRTIASQNFIFISGVQLFVRTNDCKPNFISFLECNRSHVRTIASQIFISFLVCNRSHVRTIASQMFLFYFWSAIVRTYERLQAKFYFISGVQSFARTNDCKPNDFILFLECNRSYVRTIASEILFHFWSAIVRTYERLQAK